MVHEKTATIDLKPGEQVKIVIHGAVLTGEVVGRSIRPHEWIVRTYFHDSLQHIDDIHIISERREKIYEDYFSIGTVVEVWEREDKRVGIIVDAVKRQLDDSYVYIPIVLVGTTKREMPPESLRRIRRGKMQDVVATHPSP